MVNINCAEKASKIMKEVILEKCKVISEEMFHLPMEEIEYLCRTNTVSITASLDHLPVTAAIVRSTINRIFYARQVDPETTESSDTLATFSYPKLTFKNLLKKWLRIGVLAEETFQYTKTTTTNIKKYETAGLNSGTRKDLLHNDFPEVYEFYEPRLNTTDLPQLS